MLRCSGLQACCLLAAIWSTLPPPVVSPSPLLRHTPARDGGTSTRQPKQLIYKDNPTTLPHTTVIQDDEQLKNVNKNNGNVIQGTKNKNKLDVFRLVKTETGGKLETNVALTTSHNDSRPPNDVLSYDIESYLPDNDTSYGNADDNYYNMYDNVSDVAYGNSSDVFKIHYKVYQFQMIKVGVLCTVMSIIILSTCKMLLQVLAQYAGREKPPDM